VIPLKPTYQLYAKKDYFNLKPAGSSSNEFQENPNIIVPPKTEIVFVDQPSKPVKSNIITLLILVIFRDLKKPEFNFIFLYFSFNLL